MNIFNRIIGTTRFVRQHGASAWINQRKLNNCLKRKSGPYHEFVPLGYKGPVRLRKGSLDDYTFREVCVNGEYNFKLPFVPKNVIDCGGNIGLSAIYFSLKYPQAKVVSVEPVLANFDILKENIKYYPNITGVNKGIWKTTAKLQIKEVISATGSHHFAATEVENSERYDVTAVCISDLMKQHDMDSIDLLKCDIEGVEYDLFELQKHGDETAFRDGWLSRTKAIAIELHPEFRPGCVQLFVALMDHFSFKEVQSNGDPSVVCTKVYLNTLLSV